ncbi:unnamed protein product [Chondrus crispus]|uniref:Uncharacterized protein n=1 Tax=Chondrus crispus TaxID=2769 RepID=R7QAZ5_CHOCR|nr:unnamed protein product [Chondrus crispus]CDF34576.1 unnamed protein product [Chondrus crispus]|eukprot:XP_005714395.1 unnamed protein product [Chondrus crispus]
MKLGRNDCCREGSVIIPSAVIVTLSDALRNCSQLFRYNSTKRTSCASWR